MGDPKFPVRKYDRPSHPWEGERIKRESNLVFKYGLKNKKELWKAQSFLREVRRQSRSLQARNRAGDEQARKETELLLAKCKRLGLVNETADLNDLLLINIEEVLSRRLQTIILKKGMARSVEQARQFIVHGHISMQSRRLTVPGYMVKIGEDESIAYSPTSPISGDMHPMRPAPDFVGVLKEKRQDREEGRNSKFSRRRSFVPPVVQKVVKKEIKKDVVLKEAVEAVEVKEDVPLQDAVPDDTEADK